MEELIQYIKARRDCIWVETYDEQQFIGDLISNLEDRNMDFDIYSWSETSGLRLEPKILGFPPDEPDASFRNADKLFAHIKKTQDDNNGRRTIYILKDLHLLNDAHVIKRHIRDIKEKKGSTYVNIMVLAPIVSIPIEHEKLFTVFHYSTLTKDDVAKIYDNYMTAYKGRLKKLDNQNEIRQQVIKAGVGLTSKEIKNAFSLSLIRHDQILPEEINSIKVQSIEKSGVLEYKVPKATMSTVGGNNNFKKWFEEMKMCMSDEAREYGVPTPKGYLAVGVPGSCKSYLAEAIANDLKYPFIELKASKIFSKLVGESEKRIDQAMNLVKACAPCVLLIDEVEKVFGGIQSSNASDSGVTARIVANVMQFLNDNEYGVITVMTSNDVSQLPPEFTRSGRLDSIWYFGMPNREERKEIFKIHFGLLNKEISEDLINFCADNTQHYTGAEIKTIVKSAMMKNYISFVKTKNKELNKNQLIEAIRETIPLFKSYKEKIYTLEIWSKDRARKSSSEDDEVQEIDQIDNVEML